MKPKKPPHVSHKVGEYPLCGEPLQETSYHHILVPECPRGSGIWLDKGVLEKLIGPKEGNWLQRLFEAFLLADV